MRKSTAAALIAILIVAVLTRLLPLLRFTYWGSDVGEYHYLTTQLVDSGRVSTNYYGWGITYPYFPGMYFVTGGTSLLGIHPDAALDLVLPILNALSSLLVFLIAVRIFRDDRIGLLAAAVVAVIMPYVYATSHPVPEAIGIVFLLACLALLVGPSAGRLKNLFLLLPLSAAMVVTHHLSTYFLVIMVLFAVVLRTMLYGRVRMRDVAVELVLVAFTLGTALPYWLIYATPFRVQVLGDLSVMPWWGPFAALAGLIVLWVGAVKLRQRSTLRFVPKYPDARKAGVMFAVALAFLLALTITFTFVNVLGTTITLPVAATAFLTPVFLLVAFAAPGRKPLDFSRDGHQPTSWFIVIALSTVAGSFIGARVLIPYRHIDFLMIPLAVMIGSGIVFLYDRTLAGKGLGASVSVLVAALVVTNVAVAYPPPGIMAGYDEGTNSHSLVAMHWLGGHVTGLVAADHKASMQAFGFGGVNATWDTAREALLANNFTLAKDEMLKVDSPSGEKRVDYVLLNVDSRSGTQLFPYEPAVALSSAALAKYERLPYQRFYDDGYTQVYYVNWGLPPG